MGRRMEDVEGCRTTSEEDGISQCRYSYHCERSDEGPYWNETQIPAIASESSRSIVNLNLHTTIY